MERKRYHSGMAIPKDKRRKKKGKIADILWFIVGAVIGLFSLIGLYVVAMNFL